jgi:2-keto-4-pentenoate hydratase
VSFDPTELAQEMKDAQDRASSLVPVTSRFAGFDLAAAYKVADLVHRSRLVEGARTVGRKIGFTNPDMWLQYGVRMPVWGYMYEATVVQLRDTCATFSLATLREPKIEPEIVFRLRSAPASNASPADLLRNLEWVAHGFEIVQSHFPGWRFQAPDTVADGGLHGALIVGPPQPLDLLGVDLEAALESFTLVLSCNAETIESGCGSNVLGSPLCALSHLIGVLASHPASSALQAGEIVTTGTITRARSVHPGERWRSELHGIPLPGLEVKFHA